MSGAADRDAPAGTPHGAIGEDAFAATLARRASGLLATFNAAGVLAAADVHVARRLADLAGEDDETVRLAAALAVRAVRLGHVCLDLTQARTTISPDPELSVDLRALPWPESGAWQQAVAASACVSAGPVDDPDPSGSLPPPRPLRLHGARLYLDRLWREERRVAGALLARASAPATAVDEEALSIGLDALCPREDVDGGTPDLPRAAAAAAVRGRFAVLAGGPGTGKSTTVAGILALLEAQPRDAGRRLRVALAAPTGRAAARLTEAIHVTARTLPCDEEVRARLLALRATTLHHLLGSRADIRTRFRHDAGNPLPFDLVVVDEASMLSLSLMDALLGATRPRTRLLLVGDPGQLASVEAGAVLGDIVGPAASPGGTPRQVDPPAAGPSPLAASVIVLERVHRHGGGIAALAAAVRRGAADEALGILGDGGVDGDVAFVDLDLDVGTGLGTAPQPTIEQALSGVRDEVIAAGRRARSAALAGDGEMALDAAGAIRVLCAHRRGPAGAQTWATHIERWLAAAIPGAATADRWAVGRPLLVTRNDPSLRLHNGDTGVIIATDGDRRRAVFRRAEGLLQVAPSRLPEVTTAHAMTIHRSQGSQHPSVAVLLPDAASPLLTRELLLTAITRAERRLTVVGSEASVRTAISHPIARASGLADALHGAASRS